MQNPRQLLGLVLLLAWALVVAGGQPSVAAAHGSELPDSASDDVEAQEARELTRSLREGGSRPENGARMRDLAERRRDLLGRLAERDPRAALAAVLEPGERDSLPPAVRELTEEWVDREGELVVMEIDYPDDSSRLVVELNENGTRTPVRLGSGIGKAKTGDRVRVRGVALADGTGTVLTSAITPTATSAAPRPTGSQRTAVILGTGPGASTSTHPFGNKSTTASMVYSSANAQSARTFYDQMSYGQTLITATDTAGNPVEGTSANVFGPYAVSPRDPCSLWDVSVALLNAANASIDYNNYDRILIAWDYPPGGSACGYAGVAYVGAITDPALTFDGAQQTLGLALTINSYFGNATTARVGGTTLHEIGHSLGVFHANSLDCGTGVINGSSCSSSNYGDPADLMGRSSGFGQLNGAHKDRLGWLGGRAATVPDSPATNLYTLAPYESTAVTPTMPNVLRIPRTRNATGVTSYYYVEYRQPSSTWDDYVTPARSSYTGGVLLHATANSPFCDPTNWPACDSDFGTGDTVLLDSTPGTGVGAADFNDAPLMPGQTYVDAAAGVSLTVGAASATGVALTVTMSTPSYSVQTLVNPPAAATVSGSGSGLYTSGETVSVAAAPLAGYQVSRWTDTRGGLLSTANPYTFTITADTLLQAELAAVVPPNDDFANATALQVTPARFGVGTGAASVQTGEVRTFAPCSPYPSTDIGKTVWYSYTPSTSGTLTVSALASPFDTILVAYSGSGLGSLVQVGCNDDVNSTPQSELTIPVTAGSTYRIQAGGWNGDSGTLLLDVSGPAPVPPPTVSGFSPDLGPEGTAVTINGMNLNGATAVRFGSTATSFTGDSDTQITARVPSGTAGGLVSVTSPAGTGTSSTSFTVPPPANDNFANASVLADLPEQRSLANRLATAESAEPVTFACPTTLTIGRTLWYSFTPSDSTQFIISTASSTFDTVVAVYTGSALSGLTRIGCNDNESAGTVRSRLAVPVVGGTKYYVQVGGKSSASGDLVVNVDSPPLAPTVTDPPATGAAVNTTTYTVRGAAEAGSLVRVWLDTNNNGLRESTEALVGSHQLLGSDTAFAVVVPLLTNAVRNFVVTATDAAGNESPPADVPSIRQDAVRPSVTAVSAAPTIFSPDGNGVADLATVKYTLSESVTARVVLVGADGIPVRVLVDEVQPIGPKTAVWEGLDDSGNPVPDGAYSYQVSAVDAAGNASATLDGTLTIETTPSGLPALTAPAGPVSLNAASYTVKGTVTAGSLVRIWRDTDGDGARDPTPAVSQLQLGATATAFSIVTPLLQDQVNTFLVTATDAYGNESDPVQLAPIKEDSIKPVVANAVAEPVPFQPQLDGNLSLTFDVSEPASVTVQIVTASGGLIRTLLAESAPGDAGPRTVTWDGRSTTGLIAATGTYKYRINARDSANNAAAQVTGTIGVDRTVPTITALSASPTVISPDSSGIADAASIKYTLSEAANVTLEIRSGNSLVRTLVDSATRAAGARAELWDGKDDLGEIVPQGTYTYRVSAVDLAGNPFGPVSGPSAITVDTSVAVGVPSISAPGEPQFLNAASYLVKGSATAGSFVRVLRDVNGNGLRDAEDVRLAQVQLGASATAFSLSVPLVTDAANRFLVTATDPRGNESAPAAVPTLTEDSLKPVVTAVVAVPMLISPSASAPETTEISFTLSEAALVTAKIYSPAGAAVATLALDSTPRAAGTYALAWDGANEAGVLVPTGVYTYRLNAADRAKNAATQVAGTVRVDRTAPAAPRVSDPSATVSINARAYVVRGTAEAGALVTAFLDANLDGLLDPGEAVGQQQLTAAATAFAMDVPLTPNAANQFKVIATDAAGLDSVATTVPMINEASALAAPLVTGFTPSSGPVGTVVTITGSGFAGAKSVRFNGVTAGITFNNGTQVRATVPATATTGTVEVVLASGIGESATSFAVVPKVTGFTPPRGAPGTLVTINGSTFGPATGVQFNGIAAAFSVISPTQVKATVPETATTGPITVEAATGSGSSAATFMVAPRLSGFTPGSGMAGSAVAIYGANLESATRVTFNGVTATITTRAADQLSVLVPVTATTGRLAVTTPAGSVTSVETFTPGPRITSVTPASGKAGASITLNGANFTGATAVRFGTLDAASFEVVSATRITAIVPADARVGRLLVITPAGTGTSPVNFTPTTATIASIAPLQGGAGTSIVIEGAGFGGAKEVRFNGVTARYVVNSATRITAAVPANAITGPVSVLTANGLETSAASFQVLGPALTSFGPASGPVGATVTIQGANLAGATAVRFNGTDALSFSASVDGTRVTTQVPEGASTGNLQVVTAAGTASSGSAFKVTPTVSGFTPPSGEVGEVIGIEGLSFSGATGVSFNGTTARFTVESPTLIRATVPSGTSTGPVTVTTPGGSGSSTVDFVVLPRISGFTPVSGPVGTTVTISGRTFTGATAVKFNGVSAVFSVDSSTRITATVPVGATSGNISVTTPAGTTVSAATFAVTAP